MFLSRLRLQVLIAGAFWKREKKKIIFSSIVGISFFLLIFKLLPYLPRPKKADRIGIIGNYTFDNLPVQILSQASAGLTKTAPDGNILPSLSEKWKVEDEGKKYTFYLSENIFWQDGEPITTDELHFDLEGVKTSIVNDKIIIFQLQEAFSPFPSILTIPIFKNKYVGTGKYQIKSIDYAGNYISSLVMQGADKNIVYRFYPTGQRAYQAFKLGEIDRLSLDYQNPFDSSWSDYVSVNTNVDKTQYIGLFLNLRDPSLSNKNLRQALAYATPKPEDETRATSPISPNSWAWNPAVKKYEADATSAKHLFEKFTAETETENLKLKIDTTSALLPLAEEIKKSWENILGIGVEVGALDRIPSDFQVILIVSQIPPDPDQYSFWHSTQTGNLTGYNSPKVDKILEDARQIDNQDERKEKYYDFQRFISEDCPVIFISHPTIWEVQRHNLIFKKP